MEVGDRVRVIQRSRGQYNATGTIRKVFKNTYGVKLDGLFNGASSRGYYWFIENNIEVLQHLKADMEMSEDGENTNIKEVNGENDMNNIQTDKCVENGLALLNIWYDRMESKIEKFETQEIVELKDNDTLCKSLVEHYKIINKLLVEAGYDENSFIKYFTQETAELIKEVKCEWKAEHTKLDNMLNELKALVGTCRTHEEIMGILMARGVINGNYEILVSEKL